MARTSAQRLKGFRDFLPETMALRKHVVSKFERVFQSYGFLPIETPRWSMPKRLRARLATRPAR
ncbi:MAG: hypothetical protein WKH64_10125 [Chloroflexia bacterium]